MGPLRKVVLDTSILVGLVDSRDVWHSSAITIRDALKEVQVQVTCFDCVMGETINVLARRAKERKRSSEFAALLDQLTSQFPKESIHWISRETLLLYPEIISLVRDSEGALNFNDALIALGCRQLGVECIATFDSDFDSVQWLKRVSSAHDITSLLSS